MNGAALETPMAFVDEGLDFSRAPDVHIVGNGQTTILGGTGRFEGVTGSGVWPVDAKVEFQGPTGARGTFSLSFAGGD